MTQERERKRGNNLVRYFSKFKPQSLLLLLSLTDIDEPVNDRDLGRLRGDAGDALPRFLGEREREIEREGERESSCRLRGETGESLRPRGEIERESLLLGGGEGERLSPRGEGLGGPLLLRGGGEARLP